MATMGQQQRSSHHEGHCVKEGVGERVEGAICTEHMHRPNEIEISHGRVSWQTLNSFRGGAVGFIDWLGRFRLPSLKLSVSDSANRSAPLDLSRVRLAGSRSSPD